MQVERLDAEKNLLLRSLADRAGISTVTRSQERAAGSLYHVSSLLKSIQEQLHLDGSYDGEIDQTTLLRFEVGYAWEDILGEHMFTVTGDPTVVVPVGTIEQDGILATPDDFDAREWAVHEYKATWSSSKKPIEERWYWLSQMKAYCHLLGAQTSKLWVFYVNGDWQPPVPDIGIYRLSWTAEECAETWQMLVTHREWLQKHGQ